MGNRPGGHKEQQAKKTQNMPLFSLFLLAEELWQGFAASVVSHEDSYSRPENFSCPSGWILGPTGMGCVLLQTDALTWVEASESCWKNHQQAHLAEIKNEEEKDFLRTLVSEFPDDTVYGWWIGATDLNREGSWYWTHSLEPMDFSDWYPDEPNNQHGAENCAMIYGKAVSPWMYFWNDYICTTSKYGDDWSVFSICQRALE